MNINTQNVNLLMSAGFADQFPRKNVPHIAFSGRSNVGKSSLVNSLLNRKKLARISSAPGKTITINFYDVDNKLFLVDLPGYGYAKRFIEDKKKWSELVDSYFTRNNSIDLLKVVIQLIDIKVGPTADDDIMLDWLNQTNTPYIIVATKVDKLNMSDRENNFKALSEYDLIRLGTQIIPFSALNGEGKDNIWREMLKYC